MSFDDATGHAHDLPTPPGRPAAPSIPTRRAPGRPSAAEETPAAQRTVGDILRECECVIFDPEDERMGDVVNRLVPAETRFGIRIRISAGTYKIPFNGMPPLDIGTTLADIINRWGPGKYILELVRLGASEGTTGQPLKSLTQHLQARTAEDVGQEEWPIQWDDPKVTAELKRDRDDRRRIRNAPGWMPYSDEDDSNGSDQGDQGGVNFGGGYPEYPDDGRGGPRGQVDFRDPRGGAWSQGGMGPQGASGQSGYGPMSNPYGQQGMPGMPGAPSGTIATDPNAYPPGTTWVMSPHGLIPQLPAPAAPPPPALTAEALAAAIAAAQPKREPSMLEQLLAGIVGSVAVAMQADPLGTIKGMRDALAPVPPPPAPPPPPAAPQGPTAAEITLQMQKLALESQLAMANMQRDRDLAMANIQRDRDLTLEKIQRENDTRLRDMEARQADQRAKDQIAALQAQLGAMRGQDTEQSRTLKAQIADLTKQVSAAQRSASAANDSSFIEKMLSGPMAEPIVGILGKVADKFLTDTPAQPAPQYPQAMPTGVPAMPQMQPQWAPDPAQGPQYVPPQAQWAPEPVAQPQWAPEPQYAPTPTAAPVQDFLPGVDPVVAERSHGMPPFDADAPVAQDAPADPQTSDEEPS